MDKESWPASLKVEAGDVELVFGAGPRKGTAKRGGKPIHLRSVPFVILALLMKRADEVVPHQDIIAHVKATGRSICEESFKVQMHHLKKALGEPEIVVTARNAGYMFRAASPPAREHQFHRPRQLGDNALQHASCKRERLNMTEFLELGEIKLNYNGPYSQKGVVTRNGKPLTIDSVGFAMLALFMENPGEVFSPQEIIRHLQAFHVGIKENTFSQYLWRLRQALGKPEIIENIHAKGYKFSPAPESKPALAAEFHSRPKSDGCAL